MNVKQCDRCGKQFQELPSMCQAHLPLYLIFVKEAMPYRLRNVDLCNDCVKAFEKWMNKKDGENHDE